MEYNITLPKLHTGQQEVLSSQSRFNVLACGRRFGKSTLGINQFIQPALEGLPVAWFAPEYPNVAVIWRIIDRITKPIQRSRNVQEKRIILITGGVLDMWSLANIDSALGNAYARAIIDEAAAGKAGRELEYHWQKSIRPMLTDYAGDAWFLSTPKGFNDFYKLWMKGRTDSLSYDSDWKAFQLPTRNNPHIPKSEIEKAKKDLAPHIYQQEYEAVFIENPGGLIYDTWSAENISEQAEYHPDGGLVVWGIDDGYVGELDKATGFPTGNSHPRVFLFAQLRSNGQLFVFDEDWSLQELEDPHIKRAMASQPEPEYAAVDSSSATLRGHFLNNGIQASKSSHNVEEGIKKLRSGFAADENGFRPILIHPRCKLLIHELSRYSRDMNGKVIKEHDHALDALRYMYFSLG